MPDSASFLHQFDCFGRIRFIGNDEEVGDHGLSSQDEPCAHKILGKTRLRHGKRVSTLDHDDLSLG